MQRGCRMVRPAAGNKQAELGTKVRLTNSWQAAQCKHAHQAGSRLASMTVYGHKYLGSLTGCDEGDVDRR